MRLLRVLGAFFYDLIVGDDWRITAYVVVVLALAALLLGAIAHTALLVGGAVVLMVGFAAAVVRDGTKP
jgi:hypothetical protein